MHTELIVFLNAFLLGLRHGLDWDHLAAISDIIGTANSNGAVTASHESLRLSTLYVVGHAFVVIILGASVIIAGNFTPPWLDEVAERLVGLTLIALGAWLAYTVFRKAKAHTHQQQRSYGGATTFGVGMIHGVGAETGTQMMLLASVGGAGNTALAICLLIAFVIGLLISNSAIAFAGIAGFSAARFKNLSNALGVSTAVFSIAVGIHLLF